MLDVTEGRIAFALVRFAGPLGLGDGLYPLPWEALAPSRFRRRFVLDVDRELLESAPTFGAAEAPEQSSPEFARSVTEHYGIERRAS